MNYHFYVFTEILLIKESRLIWIFLLNLLPHNKYMLMKRITLIIASLSILLCVPATATEIQAASSDGIKKEIKKDVHELDKEIKHDAKITKKHIKREAKKVKKHVKKEAKQTKKGFKKFGRSIDRAF